MPRRRRLLLAVFAHPDDETFLAGGTLATYAARGWRVRVVCATRGEAGRRGDYADLTEEQFARVRQAGLEAACRALGVAPPHFLACADRGLEACRPAATRELARLLRHLRPDVVLTFGPDGISGHPDHVAVSQIVTAAVEEVGAGTPPAECPALPRLYYVLRSPALSANIGETPSSPTTRV